MISIFLSDDHTRVKLEADDDPHDDYINANYIDVSMISFFLLLELFAF